MGQLDQSPVIAPLCTNLTPRIAYPRDVNYVQPPRGLTKGIHTNPYRLLLAVTMGPEAKGSALECGGRSMSVTPGRLKVIYRLWLPNTSTMDFAVGLSTEPSEP